MTTSKRQARVGECVDSITMNTAWYMRLYRLVLLANALAAVRVCPCGKDEAFCRRSSFMLCVKGRGLLPRWIELSLWSKETRYQPTSRTF